MNLSVLGLTIVVALTACDRTKTAMKPDRFPGFTQVGTDGESARLYIDLNGVKQKKSVVTLKLVRVVEGGYVIQDALTDCRSKFRALDGVQYKDDGTSDKEYSGDAQPQSFQGHAGIAALVKKVCDKADEARTITGHFNDIKALELLYGPYKREANAALWQGISLPPDFAEAKRLPIKEGLTKRILSQDYQERDVNKHFFLTATRPNEPAGGCHACPVLIGGAIFVRLGDRWKIEREFPYLMISGAFGEPPELKWTRIGRNHFALFEKFTDIGQGYLYFSRKIIGIGENEGVPLLSIAEGADGNRGEDVNVDMTMMESSSDYWDAKVVITRRKAGETATIEQIYRFEDGKYRLIEHGR